MQTLWQDVRYSLRLLIKKPGFTVVVLLTLALGIGANTAIFSVVNAVLLQPLPYQAPHQLVLLTNSIPSAGVKPFPLSPPEFGEYRNQTSVLQQVAAYQPGNYNLTGGNEPERLRGSTASASFFPLLGVAPLLGRAFSVAEDQPGNDGVVVISYGLWQRRFGGDPNTIGQTLQLNGRPRIVIGVMPSGFDFPEELDAWVPLALAPNQFGKDRLGSQSLRVIARLANGVQLRQAQAEISAVANRFYQRYADFYLTGNPWELALTPLHEQITGPIKTTLLILLGAVGFMLLIACANVTNLLLVRAATRQKEIAVRLAIGASSGRLIRQLLTESVLLAILGGLGGLALAAWGIKLLIALGPSTLPRLKEVRLDRWVLGFTFGLSLLTGIIFGLAPAWVSTKVDLQKWLKEGGRAMTGAVGHRLRTFLVIAEVALSLTLLIGAGLMARSLIRLLQVDPGFKADHVLTLRISPPRSKYATQIQQAAYYQQIIERESSLPGVSAVGGVSALPLSGEDARMAFTAEGVSPTNSAGATAVQVRLVTPNYFKAIGIPLLQGRFINEQDQPTAPLSLVINQTMAQRLWPDQNPIGRRISFNRGGDPWYSVVGVVADVKHAGLDLETGLDAYASYQQSPTSVARDLNLVMRTETDPLALATAARAEVRAIDRDQPVYNVATLDQVMARSTAQRRFNLLLLSILASVALLLAAVGIYGVISYAVTQRTHEIGVRLALGAQRPDIFKLVVGQGLFMTLIGVAVGIAAALALTRLMSSLVFGVSVTDPITFTVVSLLLLAVALLACYLPARRATKVDPMIALRYE